MNIYKIIIFSCGVARECRLSAYDMLQAINQCDAMPNEIIEVKLVGSTNQQEIGLS